MKVDMRDAFFHKLVEKAILDSNIIILSADHGAFALEDFAINYPEQYINIGISEQNMVGVAAGLALSGKIVFIYGIAPFVSLRVLEQLTIDVAAMNLSVNVISVGAGLTYSTDGQTHLGLQDISVIMTIPGISILNSSDPINTSDFVEICLAQKKPHYIRIEKEKLVSFERKNLNYLEDGFSLLHKSDSGTLIISTGVISHQINEIILALSESKRSVITQIDLHQIKPLKEIVLISLFSNYEKIVVIDESYPLGLDALIGRICLKVGWKGQFITLNIEDSPIFTSGERTKLRDLTRIGKQNLEDFITLLAEG
jgi:transketolase